MELSAALCIRPGVTAIIGSGGKTTLLYALARVLSADARVLVCTTTHILPPEHMPVLLPVGICAARGASGAKSRLHCVRRRKRKAPPAKPAL